jgi:hypothetical protein
MYMDTAAPGAHRISRRSEQVVAEPVEEDEHLQAGSGGHTVSARVAAAPCAPEVPPCDPCDVAHAATMQSSIMQLPDRCPVPLAPAGCTATSRLCRCPHLLVHLLRLGQWYDRALSTPAGLQHRSSWWSAWCKHTPHAGVHAPPGKCILWLRYSSAQHLVCPCGSTHQDDAQGLQGSMPALTERARCRNDAVLPPDGRMKFFRGGSSRSISSIHCCSTHTLHCQSLCPLCSMRMRM